MTDTTTQIVLAAKARFMRYGYGKTTMGDIATEAGVARQTVYNAFASKEEIMRVVVREAAAGSLERITSVWGEARTLAEKLAAFHDLGPVAWYIEMRKAPDWAELMEGMHAAAGEEMAVMDQRWKDAMTAMFTADAATATLSKAEIAEVVDMFYNASLNAKHGAADVDHLRQRLATLRKATLALVAAE